MLVTEIDGVPLRFTNGVDIDQLTGEVYFTDSSMNFNKNKLGLRMGKAQT